MLLASVWSLSAVCVDKEFKFNLHGHSVACHEFAMAGNCDYGFTSRICPRSCGHCKSDGVTSTAHPMARWNPPASPPSPPLATVCVERSRLVNVHSPSGTMPPHDASPRDCFFGQQTGECTRYNHELMSDREAMRRGVRDYMQCCDFPFSCSSHGLSWTPRPSSNASSAEWAPPSVQAYHRTESHRLDSFVIIRFLDAEFVTLNMCISPVFWSQADPEYHFCCGVAQPYAFLTIEIWDAHRTEHILPNAFAQRRMLASRSFRAPDCNGAFWFPMQAPPGWYAATRHCKVQQRRFSSIVNSALDCHGPLYHAGRQYMGEVRVSVSVTTDAKDASQTCALVPHDRQQLDASSCVSEGQSRAPSLVPSRQIWFRDDGTLRIWVVDVVVIVSLALYVLVERCTSKRPRGRSLV